MKKIVPIVIIVLLGSCTRNSIDKRLEQYQSQEYSIFTMHNDSHQMDKVVAVAVIENEEIWRIIDGAEWGEHGPKSLIYDQINFVSNISDVYSITVYKKMEYSEVILGNGTNRMKYGRISNTDFERLKSLVGGLVDPQLK